MNEQLPDPNASTLSPGLRKSIVFVLSFAGGFLALGTLINAFGVMGEQGVTWAYITRIAPHFLMGAALLWGAFGLVDPSDAKSPGLPGAVAAKTPAAPAPAAKPAPRGRIAPREENGLPRGEKPGMPPAQAWSLFLILSGALILMVGLVFAMAGVSNELGRTGTPAIFGGATAGSTRNTELHSEIAGVRDELRVARGAHKERLRTRLNKLYREQTQERASEARARKQQRAREKPRAPKPDAPLAEEYEVARLLAIIGLPLLLLGLGLRWYRQ